MRVRNDLFRRLDCIREIRWEKLAEKLIAQHIKTLNDHLGLVARLWGNRPPDEFWIL